ncbi:MAG TPA: hypothetical protein VHX14_12000 [Thermoanaerobaculia bacterium]|nr:hypothetical protein [Thermoanaerobaculia bacterium]
MKRRVLWVEDSAFGENGALLTPVVLSGRYDIRTAVTATAGLMELTRLEFDAVIVDIRILPGSDPRWIDEYSNKGRSSKAARLGLRLLEVVLGEPGVAWSNEKVPDEARDPLKYGVLTVEAKESLSADLDRLGVIAYRNKHAAASARLLLELIDEVVAFKGKR